MNDDRHLDALEHYLQTARVLDITDPQLTGGGAHGNKTALRLEGGVQALAKPEAGTANGPRAIRREAAAWLLAREIGITHMVACTVLRDSVPLLDGTTGAASVQVIWSKPTDFAHPGPFPDHERWFAAVFDAIVAIPDRVQNNWLAVETAAGERRLKLVDHGYAFGLQGPGFNSTFYNELHDEPIPDFAVEALRRCLSPRQSEELQALFTDDPEALSAALDRVRQLVETGVLAI